MISLCIGAPLSHVARPAADLNILIIGCSRDSGERHHSGVWWNSKKPAYTPDSDAFSATEIGNQLQNILDQDNRGNVNVTVTDGRANNFL